MNKEEILEASKKENEKKDPYVLAIQSKAGNIASVAMLVLAFIYLMYELQTTSEWNSAIYSIITVYYTAYWGYHAYKIEKDRKKIIFAGSVWGILTILLILDYFKII